MLISYEFDIAIAERRKQAERNSLATAGKLNKRLLLFIADLQKDSHLKEGARNRIRAKLLENL